MVEKRLKRRPFSDVSVEFSDLQQKARYKEYL